MRGCQWILAGYIRKRCVTCVKLHVMKLY